MIAYIEGEVIVVAADYLIVKSSGIGYKVYTNPQNVSLDNNVALFCHTAVSQDDIRLFGFASREDLKTFEVLVGVSGVGPKLALAILTVLGRDGLVQAVDQSASTILAKVPKVGPKLAAKILIELKDKVDIGAIGAAKANVVHSELIDAMEGLGYKRTEYLPLIQQIPPELDNDAQKIKWLLKNIKK